MILSRIGNLYLQYSSLWRLVVMATAVFCSKYPRYLICIYMENIVATTRIGAGLLWHPKSNSHFQVYRFFTSLRDPYYIFQSTASHYLLCLSKQQTSLRSAEECKQTVVLKISNFLPTLVLASRIFLRNSIPVIGEGVECSRLNKGEIKSLEFFPPLISESSKLSVFPLQLI
jgi:hypothetical protein